MRRSPPFLRRLLLHPLWRAVQLVVRNDKGKITFIKHIEFDQ